MFVIPDSSVIDSYTFRRPLSKAAKALNLLLWVLQFFAALACLTAGATRLREMRVATFEPLSFRNWLSYFVAAAEVIGAFLIVIPTTAQLGALVLAGTLIGAIVMQLWLTGGISVSALVFLVITASVAWYRGWHV